MLCQLAAPVDPFVSSSHGRLVDGALGRPGSLKDGNSRRPAKISDGEGPGGTMCVAGRDRPRGKRCPLCGGMYLDMLHHYNKRHPGERFVK